MYQLIFIKSGSAGNKVGFIDIKEKIFHRTSSDFSPQLDSILY